MQTRLLRILAVGLILTFASTAVLGDEAEMAAAEAEAKSSMLAYKKCMEIAANVYASSDAEPSDVADAAQSRCNSDFRIYENAVANYFSSTVSRAGVPSALLEAEDHTQGTKLKAREMVIRLVIESRLHL